MVKRFFALLKNPCNQVANLFKAQAQVQVQVPELDQAPDSKQTAASKKIHIIGGGTVFHISPHLALCSPAYGNVARMLYQILTGDQNDWAPKHDLQTHIHLTKMAGGSTLETNEDILNLINKLVADPATKIVFLTAAMCDFEGAIGDIQPDKYGERLKSRDGALSLNITPAQKVVGHIRKTRKDIFAVAFKTTTGATPEEQYIAGLNLLKESSVNLVLANDTKTRLNMVITPEEARYHQTTDRYEAIFDLVEMSLLRSHLTFTRSTVVAGDPIPWNSELVPQALRKSVDYCISRGAYKPFRGATVGHFACKLNDNTFLTSIRKSNFNDLEKNGLVKIVTDGPDSVIAYGAKPSVGGMSQRIIFHDHQDYDCIVHFHCPKKPGSLVPEVSQREYECGSHQCGQNTSNGLQQFGNLSAVYLQEHGPNIVFHHSIDPQEVIDFIEQNFDLEDKTGGYVSLGQILKQNDTFDDFVVLNNQTVTDGPLEE